MKKKFSVSWVSSKQKRKQRKYRFNAPLHIKRKFVSANLSKELRKKYGRRSFPLRKNDVVKIMNGKFRKKSGKVLEVNVVRQKIIIEGIQKSKKDGTKVNALLNASNLQITELNLDDKKRIAAINRKNNPEKGKNTETKPKLEEKKNKQIKEK
jgi:large subunit ribosomal protein L24